MASKTKEKECARAENIWISGKKAEKN